MPTNNELVQLIIDAQNLSADELKKAANDVELLGKKAAQAEKELNQLKIDQASLASYRELREETKKLETQVAESTAEYKRANTELKKNKNSTIENSVAVEKLKIENQKAKKALTSHNSALVKLRGSLKGSNVDLRSVAKSEKILTDAIEKTSRGIKFRNIELDKQVASLKKSQIAERQSVVVSKEKIAALQKEEIEIRKQFELNKKQVTEQRKLVAAVSQYEAGLKKLNARQRRGVISAGNLIRLEKQLRESLKLTERQTNSSRRAAEADNRALVKRISSGRKLVAEKKKQAAQTRKNIEADKRATVESKKTAIAIDKYRIALIKLNSQLKKGKISQDQFVKAELRLRVSLKLTEKQALATARALRSSVGAGAARKSTDLLTKSTRRLAQAYTVVIAAQKAAAAVGAAVKGQSELESAITRVEKTTNLTTGELVKMTQELQKMSTDVTPTATNELLRFAEIAGQLGAESTEDILRIAAAADALGVSTDLAGEEAVTLLSRMLKMTGEGLPAINNLSSSIVDLGNNVAASESEIARMTKEVITGTTSINLGSAAAAGFGATLKEMGQTGERSRSSLFKLSQSIKDAAVNGGKDLENLIQITRLTGDQIDESLGRAPEEVLLAFVEGLSKVKQEGGLVASELEKFGIKGVEATSVLEVLADQSDRLAENVARSTQAYKDGDRHIIEASKAYADQSAQISKLLNRFTQLKVAAGSALTDETLSAVESINEALEGQEGLVIELTNIMADFGGELIDTVSSLEKFAESLGLIEAAGFVFTALKQALEVVQLGFLSIAAGVLSARIAIKEFFGATGEELQGLRDDLDETFKSMEDNITDLQEIQDDFEGKSSSTYRDLVDAADKYKDSLGLLTDEQREQLDNALKADGFNAELTVSYANLTTAIVQNAATLKEQERLVAKKIIDDKENLKLQQRTIELTEKAAETRKLFNGLTKEAEATLQLLTLAFESGTIKLDEYTSQTEALNSAIDKNAADVKKAADNELVLRASRLTSLDAVLNMIEASIDYKEEINDLEIALSKATKGTAEYEAAVLDLALTQKEQARNLENIKLLRELEAKTLFELTIIQRAHNLELQILEQQRTSGVITIGQYNAALEELRFKTDFLNAAVGESVSGTDDYTDSLNRNTNAISKNTKVKDQNNDASDKVQNKAQAVTTAISFWILAQNRLNEELDYSGENTSDLEDKLFKLNTQYKSIITTVGRWWDDLRVLNNQAVKREQDTIRQTLQLRKMQDQVESGSLSLKELAEAGKRADFVFDLLGDQQLEPLRDAIEDAKREFQDLTDTINDSLADVQDRLDAALGNEQDIVKRKFQREMDELLTLLDTARESGDRALIDKINSAISKLSRAQKIEFADEFGDQLGNNSSSSGSGSAAPAGNLAGGVFTVNLNLPNGNSASVNVASEGDASSLVDALAQLGEINLGSGG